MTRSEKEQALVTLAAAALSHPDSSGTDSQRAQYAVDVAEETLREITQRLDEEEVEAQEKTALGPAGQIMEHATKLFGDAKFDTGYRYGQDGEPSMTTADRPAIAAHAVAKVSSDEFRPSIEAAFEVIRGIREYQDMTALIMHNRGARVQSADEELEMTAGDLADVILYALCTGFAFGADYGESKLVEGLMIGGKA